MGRRLKGRLSVEGGQDYPKPSRREPTSLVGQANGSLCDIIILIHQACFLGWLDVENNTSSKG